MLYVKYANPVDKSTFDFKNDPFISVLFNDAPDAIFILDSKDYSILECNNKSLEIFETESKMSLISLPSFRLYESEPVEFSRHLLEKNIKNGGEHTQELAFRTLKQNIFWGRLKKRPFVIEDKEYILLRISKINDYLSAEETLSTLLRGTAQVTGVMFLKEFVKLLCRTFDVKYSFIAKLSADKKKFSIIQSCGSLTEENDKNYTIAGTMLENVARGYTTFYPAKVKELFPLDNLALINEIEGFMGTPVYGNSGEVMGMIAFLNDKPLKEVPNSRYILSIFASRTAAELQRIRSKEILKEQTRELAVANSIKDKLLTVIADNLLDPMDNLIGFSDNLQENTNKLKKEEYIERMEIIDYSLRNIYFILSNLSEWSRLHREPIHPRFEKFELNESVKAILRSMKCFSNLKELKIESDLDKSIQIHSDKSMFTTIVRNIVSNAIKYNKIGGSVKICSSYESKNLILTIADTGKGMNISEIKHLQKTNFNIENGLNENNKSNLGFILSRQYIELLGGRLELKSEIDKGTIVQIIIPDNQSLN
jgi:signal transduction histidine kinase